MAAQVGDYEAEARRIAAGEDQAPIGADAGAAVEQEQRFTVAAAVDVHLKAVDVEDHGVTLQRRRRLIQAGGILEGEGQR
jgi:hypothetical protein